MIRDDGGRAAAPLVGVLLMVAVAVVLGGGLAFSAFQVAGQSSDPAPVAEIGVEFDNLDDGVAQNDTIRITHGGGDELKRENIVVTVGDDVVYNATADSESTNANFQVPGLVVEVDDDEFNDLNKPCRVDGERVSPKPTCKQGGQPGDPDGSDDGVTVEWSENVSAGETLVIQERNASGAYDVFSQGETVTVKYEAEGLSVIIAEATVESRG